MPTFKRKVFYVSGFDPRGARHYHQMYQEAAAKFARLSGKDVQVGARSADGWVVENRSDDVAVDYQFLAWDDIVRRAWIRHPLKLVGKALGMYASYASHCNWRIILNLELGPLVTFLYPLAMLVLLPLLLWWVLSWFLWSPLALVLGVAASVGAMVRFKALWLLRFFVFNHEAAREDDAELMDRLDDFAQRIHASFAAGYDEVLIVAHSNGSILAVPLLEKIFALGELPPHARVLTLGHCIPLVSHLSYATRFRTELERLATREFSWLDIGFPPDGACYALTNPFLPYAPDYKVRLKLLSARFYKYYDQLEYTELRRSKYQLHFEYLRTADKLSPLNYIGITTGRKTLADVVAEAA